MVPGLEVFIATFGLFVAHTIRAIQTLCLSPPMPNSNKSSMVKPPPCHPPFSFSENTAFFIGLKEKTHHFFNRFLQKNALFIAFYNKTLFLSVLSKNLFLNRFCTQTTFFIGLYKKTLYSSLLNFITKCFFLSVLSKNRFFNRFWTQTTFFIGFYKKTLYSSLFIIKRFFYRF